MSPREINVIAVASYKGEETPRKICVDGETLEVVRMMETWIDEDVEKRSRKRFFRFMGDDKRIHTIYFDEESQKWFYKELRRS